ncbi:hypothetical protein HPB47_006011 [Ixodes persulcatus]|uniref:Uncharacterized protein n=1 Tax=Ixodes persulcatus TaxID=34615 RepID=A0AC60PB90_IXOPE|nr:hypothetical protein HPB47_006011 [Ixodes persulcatus]
MKAAVLALRAEPLLLRCRAPTFRARRRTPGLLRAVATSPTSPREREALYVLHGDRLARLAIFPWTAFRRARWKRTSRLWSRFATGKRVPSQRAFSANAPRTQVIVRRRRGPVRGRLFDRSGEILLSKPPGRTRLWGRKDGGLICMPQYASPPAPRDA